MQRPEAGKIERLDPLWPAQITVAVAILLGLALPDKLTIGPGWLLPACEGALLLALVVTAPSPQMRDHPLRRYFRMGLTGLVSAVNLVSLLLLVHYLVSRGHTPPRPLLLGGIVLWVTAILLFSVWYWELDRGGPIERRLRGEDPPDFLFPQMGDAAEWAPRGWEPRFGDYLYLAFTNATAFSPTDTMPLTQTAKLLMAAQAFASLTTIALVVARAVNILGN
ncbi:MAG: putative rane protein [Solirubrobacterales bacterium]|jgi:hypothetical protein|nr:putative rane protein [Solirubrobacterales bacterium]